MKSFRIGFIAGQPMQAFVDRLIPHLHQYCSLSVFYAGTNDDARRHYLDHVNEMDAFIFSGRAFLVFATGGSPSPEKPCFAFDNIPPNFQDVFFRILLTDRQFDFSRCFIDAVYEDGDVWGLRELFPPEQMPLVLDNSFKKYTTLSDQDMQVLNDQVLQKHIELHRAHAIDLSITRFSPIALALKRMKLPCVYMLPSREYVINFFINTINFLNQRLAQESTTGAIVIRCMSSTQCNEALMAQAVNALSRLAGEKGYDFTFLRNRNMLEVITRLSDLTDLTHNFQDASFAQLLGFGAVENTIIGIGSGQGPAQAKLNAVNAVYMTRPERQQIFYVSAANEIIGPLGTQKPVLQLMPDDNLIRLAQRFKLDHRILQKIAAHTRITGSTRVTASEMALCLDVTPRSAYRILNKIADSGGASIYSENACGRGRPCQRYHLTFLEQESKD